MRIDWLFFPSGDVDGGWPDVLPTDPRLLHSSHFQIPGSTAIQEVLTRFSKLAQALVLYVYGAANSTFHHKLSVIPDGSRSIHAGKYAKSAMSHLKQEIEQLQSLPFFALATAFLSPSDYLSPKVLAAPLENAAGHVSGRSPYGDQLNGCTRFSFSEITWMRDAIEPRTGVKFPKVLDRDSDQNDLEVLMGTGSRAMKFVRVKSIKIYAFGLYIQPYSVCRKLGPKYASISLGELNDHSTCLVDLLREDIDMTVRLVVTYKGLKISAVKDAFEKSLRNRLQKVNPETDYQCVKEFGSYFSQDLPLPVGTAIDFRQTSDGHLITEIGGKHIGAVHSKELCRAFFDMYLGDMPVSAQAKEEVGNNMAGLIRRC